MSILRWDKSCPNRYLEKIFISIYTYTIGHMNYLFLSIDCTGRWILSSTFSGTCLDFLKSKFSWINKRLGYYCMKTVLASVIQPTFLQLPQNTEKVLQGKIPLRHCQKVPQVRAVGNAGTSTGCVVHVPEVFHLSDLLLTEQRQKGKPAMMHPAFAGCWQKCCLGWMWSGTSSKPPWQNYWMPGEELGAC